MNRYCSSVGPIFGLKPIHLPHGWYLSSSPIVTADWKGDHDEWTVPVGGGSGKEPALGRQSSAS